MQNQVSVATFRRLTPAMVESQRLAMANDIVATTKAEVAITLKKAAPALGIEGTTYHILDILIGLTKADDWKQDRRPLVAISNEKLAEYVGRTTRTVARCLKKLVEAGVLAYRDSPTGRRFIYRNDGSGAIDRGYGLDFSPARQRIKELQELAKAFTAELKAKQQARREVTRLSRAIADLLVLLGNDGKSTSEHENNLSLIMNAQAGYAEKAERLRVLYELVVASQQPTEPDQPASEADKGTNMSGVDDINVTPYNNTNIRNPKKSNKRTSSNDDDTNLTDAKRVDYALEKEQKSKSRTIFEGASPQATGSNRLQKWNDPQDENGALSEVSIGLINSATNEVKSILGESFRSWAHLIERSQDLKLLIGLSEDGWRRAIARVGRHLAAAILVTTCEKALRSPDQLARPAGYFLACVDRAIDGKLALHRSLFGLANV